MIYDTLVGRKKNPHNFAYIPTKSLVRGEDGDSEVLHANLETNVLDHDSMNNNTNPCIEEKVDFVEDGPKSPCYRI